MTPERSGVATRLAEVREQVRIACEAAGRPQESVTLMAVTKGHGVESIAAALDLGLTDIGESRVQEAEAKARLPALAARPVRWHMIGHVQRNKARPAAALFDTVHSLDSIALAGALDRHRADAAPPLAVYIEVEMTGIAARTGIAPDQAADLLAAVGRLRRLRVEGLMTIAPPGAVGAARDCFARLRRLRDDLAAASGVALPGLSMGMSDDFEAAIAEGSTIVRLGRALFGERAPLGDR